MFALKGRQDGFRLKLCKEFIPKIVEEKYSKILQSKHSFIVSPIDFLNETIQKVEVLGINNAVIMQQQPSRGEPMLDPNRIAENNFMHPSTDVAYRSPENPLSLIDKTVNITFKHTLGYINYFMIFESFLYQYSRDMKYSDMPKYISVEMYDDKGFIYCRLKLMNPIIDGIDMLSFDYSQPIAQSQTFNVSFKYSNFDYQFIEETLD